MAKGTTPLRSVPRTEFSDIVVDTAAIGAKAVTVTELGDLAVGSAQLAAGAVGTTQLAAGAVTGAKASATLSAMRETSTIPTVATTGTTELLIIAPAAGSLILAKVAFKDALAQHASNFLTFAIKNKGQAGSGTTDMLAADDTNTTKTSTGTAISAYTPRTLTLHATPGNLVVAAGDVLAVQLVSASTLANTLTEGNIKLVFSNAL